MTLPHEQNYLDLRAIVASVNEVFADSISFVFLPGDNADHGAAAEYALVRDALDALRAPWFCIVGDHDVHERSTANFTQFLLPSTHFAFGVGRVHFFALNAFGIPDPGAFSVLSEELVSLERSLRNLPEGAVVVVLLHCYPSDLKQGGGELRQLLEDPRVRLVDMGHTHYNEVANDGKTLYTATRSTGQIEEGPVGFSVTNIDGDVISWKFLPLNDLPFVMITSPGDVRFLQDSQESSIPEQGAVRVRAKIWGKLPMREVRATLDGQCVLLESVAGSQVWEGSFAPLEHSGTYRLTVEATDPQGAEARDEIHISLGPRSRPARAERDQDNALGAWPERGLLGTQLGPNKNGRKW